MPTGGRVITTNNRQEKQMKNLTSKQATMTVTIKNGTDIETFFFYGNTGYSDLVNAIENIQKGGN